jgi:putative hemolysin
VEDLNRINHPLIFGQIGYRILTSINLSLADNNFSMPETKFIDVRKILRQKAPTLYRILPGFLINWLRKKLREEEINRGITQLNQFEGLRYNDEILKYLDVKVEVKHPENIPAEGSVIIAANHPLGGLDGMALIKIVGEKRPDVRFIVNDILKNLKNFGDVFVGVNKVGNTSRTALQVIDEVYSSEAAILVFPAGLVSRKLPDGIKDLEWNKSFIARAVRYQKPVIPVFIEGKNSRFFYNFARFRKRLGIKGNLEMLLLPDEMFKQKGKTIRIHVGKPIHWTVFDKRISDREWAAKLRDYVYSSKLKQGEEFKP